MNEALAQTLHERGAQLSEHALAKMYENPFWSERFGDRGRQHASQDGNYHVAYLVEALRASDVAILGGYARWLQSVLVSRGMCSRHIAENFQRLAEVITRDVADAEPAVSMLQEAQRALLYEAGPARRLQDQEAELARVLAGELCGRLRLSSSPCNEEQETEQLRDHIAYLADAIHAARPQLFASHVAWMVGFLARRSLGPERLRQRLRSLERELTQREQSSPELPSAAREAIDLALAALTGGAELGSAAPGGSA